MRLTANRMRLAALTKTLLLKWDTTRDSWRDEQAQAFEKAYLDELDASVGSAMGVAEELDEWITKLRSDCE